MGAKRLGGKRPGGNVLGAKRLGEEIVCGAKRPGFAGIVVSGERIKKTSRQDKTIFILSRRDMLHKHKLQGAFKTTIRFNFFFLMYFPPI